MVRRLTSVFPCSSSEGRLFSSGFPARVAVTPQHESLKEQHVISIGQAVAGLSRPTERLEARERGGMSLANERRPAKAALGKRHFSDIFRQHTESLFRNGIGHDVEESVEPTSGEGPFRRNARR